MNAAISLNRNFGTLASVLAFTALPLAGCSGAADEEIANAVITSALQSDNNGEVGDVVADSPSPECENDPNVWASKAAARPQVFLNPVGCATKTATGAALHIDFNQCTGPFGRMLLAGGVDAKFSNGSSCEAHVEVADSGNLTSNGNPLNYKASGDIRLISGQRSTTWHSEIIGTSRRGKPLQMSSDRSVVLNEVSHCVDVMGTSTGTVGGRSFSTNIESLSVCPGKCPSAGVLRAHIDGRFRDRTLEVRFDGSKHAQVTGINGDEFTVEMQCEE
ncbi:MAG: hypothetical protein SFV15_16615 [Polyangiaceae bacterium]|nr:hypothetical protein [Polyangiaceae bacterium]